MRRLFLVAGSVLFLGLVLLAPSPVRSDPVFSGKIEVVGHGVADAGGQAVAFFSVRSDSNASVWANVSWRVLQNPVPDRVYELVGPRVDASQYLIFHDALSRQLGVDGKRLDLVALQDLGALPSGSFLLLPFGAMPDALLGGGRLENLLLKNMTVLFIGLPFDVTLASDGAAVKNVSAWSDASKSLGFGFAEAPSGKAKYHSFLKSQYSVRLNAQNHGTTLYAADGVLYAVSYASGGTLVLVPNTLDQGWASGVLAANDVAQIIDWGQWQSPLALADSVQLLGPGQNALFSPGFSGSYGFARLNVAVQNVSYAFSSNFEALSGRQINEVQASPSEKIHVSATLGEHYPSARQLVLTLEAVKNGKTFATFPAGVSTVKSLGFASSSFLAPNESGDYLLELVDQDRGVHARSALHVVNLSVRFIREDYSGGAFGVQFFKDGLPQADVAYRISVDGANNKTVLTDGHGVASFNTKASLQSAHVLAFAGPDGFFQVRRPHLDGDFLSSPLAFGIFALFLGVVGFGFFFAVKSRSEVFIDVPDFSDDPVPMVTISGQSVIQAFRHANERFQCNGVPLSLLEVKEALHARLGLPIRSCIRDVDVVGLLGHLQTRGVVFSAHGYYGLFSWVKRGSSVEAFVLRRMVLDTLVQSGLTYGEKRDGTLQVGACRIRLYGSQDAGSVLDGLHAGRLLLVFPTGADVAAFVQRLRSATDAVSVRLYLEWCHGTFAAVSVDQLAVEVKS